MLRKDTFVPNEWFHCYNRGTAKQTIFHTPRDYERFLMLLFASNARTSIRLSNIGSREQGPTLLKVLDMPLEEKLVDIGAYALMPNHFHLLLRELTAGGITLFMRKLSTGYAMYYNIKRDRTGTLFQGKFKSRHVGDDFYLQRLLNYIHANPAELFEPQWKQGKIRNEKLLHKQLKAYQYSSLPDYIGQERKEAPIINKQAVLSYMENPPTLDALFEEARIFAREADNF